MVLKNYLISKVSLVFKHSLDDNGVECIVIETTATGGIKGTTVDIKVDGQEYIHSDYIFGSVSTIANRKPLEELPFFKDDKWDLAASTATMPGAKNEKEGFLVVENHANKDSRVDNWSAVNVWGFQEFQGKKYYVRRVHFESSGLTKDLLVIYDFKE